ncbi:pentatricopeptide repeat-containing protein [Hordeum vulgare]|nr:pentatricopeptide repeat-containing protein [Hordeum vulgare]
MGKQKAVMAGDPKNTRRALGDDKPNNRRPPPPGRHRQRRPHLRGRRVRRRNPLPERVFDGMPDGDVVTWNSMVDGYVSNGLGALALVCFREMHEALEMQHDGVGIIAALAACCLESALMQGQEIHAYVIRHGMEHDLKVGTSILDMYCKCGDIASAEGVFPTMPSRTMVTWNCMIGEYALNERPEEAFDCFVQIKAEGHQVEVVTAINLLAASAQTESSLKVGKVKSSEKVFRQMTTKTLVSWNNMIAAYMYKEMYMEAITLFLDLLNQPLYPDYFTMSAVVVPAFVLLGLLRQCRQMCNYIIRLGYGESTLIMNAVMHMYARCGHVLSSRKIFYKMAAKDVISLNTMIMGYAIHDQGRSALEMFSKMKQLQPVLRRELQLVGVSALLIACKYEEIWAPEVNDFILISNSAYMREHILKMEKAILNRLEWNLRMPMLYVFLVCFTKAASSSSHHKSDKEYGLVQSKPSTVAAAAVYAARLTLKMTPLWTDTLRHHNGFTEAQLVDAAKILIGGHGMGRTCVYVHHVDKDAFLKGNIDPDPDELDMVFDLCPSYGELLEQVRKDLNWMDPSDVVEFAGRHNVGFGMHIRWKTMRVNSEQRWLAYKDTVAESLDKALELFAMKTNVPNLLDLNRVASSIVEAIPATINEEANIEPLSCVYEANEEVNIEHEPLVEANYEHYDDGNVLHDNNLGDLDKYNLQETMDHSIPYSRGYASESDDEGPDEEVDEEGFTAKEAEAFTKEGQDGTLSVVCLTCVKERGLMVPYRRKAIDN